jgi:hypothetical protein
MYAVQSYLKEKNITNIQTYMDKQLFNSECHCPTYIQELQQSVLFQMETFEGYTFLDWARKNEFFVTDTGWHPLEEAHAAACKLWYTRYAEALAI